MDRIQIERTEESVPTLASRLLAGDRSALGQAITRVESTLPAHREEAQALLKAIDSEVGGAWRIGVSGVPGVGKSSFLEALGLWLCESGRRVAVLAVDPSSQRSGGSILGDKTRMVELARHPNAFVRPSPSALNLGGVGQRTRESILLCEAAGYDIVFVETVGVGQSEALVAGMVDSFLVLMLPRAGDELQGIKRGILELADVLAINKSEGENRTAAGLAQAELKQALRLLRPPTRSEWQASAGLDQAEIGPRSWHPPVLLCSALSGEGMDEVWLALESHYESLGTLGREEKRKDQDLAWMWSLVDEAVLGAFRRHPEVVRQLSIIENEVRGGQRSATEAAHKLLRLANLDESERSDRDRS